MTKHECKEIHARKYTFANIGEVWQLAATLRNGKYAWPGGYPLYFITSDGAALSFESVRENYSQIIDSIAHKSHDGWRVVACAVNWEDDSLHCDHSGERIESAYAEPDDCDQTTRESAIERVSYVVDDAGSGRRIGSDVNAIVRDVDKFRYRSVLVGWGSLVVAVHSYLDVELDDSEVADLATDYVVECGALDAPCAPDFIIR